MLSFLYVYSDHSILECYNLFSGVELSMTSFFVIIDETSQFSEGSANVSIATFLSGLQKLPKIGRPRDIRF